MQQEGVVSVLLPHLASLFHPAVCPPGESTVLMADTGAGAHRFRFSSGARRGWKGVGEGRW